MTEPALSPHEIATFLLDSGFIDRGTANLLEVRIKAHGDSRASQGHAKGIEVAAKKAAAVAASVKGAAPRAAAQKVWRAVEGLLPEGGREAEKQAYARGYKDGVATNLKRQRQAPDAK
jgi:hypothetical protein